MKKRVMVVFLVVVVIFFAFMSVMKKTTFFSVESEFVNSQSGYILSVPKRFEIDKSFLPDTVRLIGKTCTVEIYVQPCAGKDETASYINYTNDAILSNKNDCFGVREIKSFGKTVLFWERKKLSRIENDKNHYIKIDIPENGCVYTIFVKSAEKLSDYKKYEALLKIIKPSGNNEFSPSKKHVSGRKFNIMLHYSDFLETYNPYFVGDVLRKAYSEGRTVELTLQPNRDHVGENTIFSVLDGKYDEFLNAYAKDIAEFSHPVLFRLCNEMNGDWCEYSGYRMSLDTELYRELYRYVYDIFKKNNANNVIWVWNPNGKSFPDFKWNSERMYYPGNEFVDVLGLTLYNTGNYYEGENWAEFSELYRPLYEKAVKEYAMPFMITEFASARCGGNKEDWTRKMLSEMAGFPKIKAAVWWNHADLDWEGNVSRAYYINDTTEMTDIFKEYFSMR